MSIKQRLAKLLRLATMTLITSKCFKNLVFSKTMHGLLAFLLLGIVFTYKGLWNEYVLQYFQWLGPFFFASRGMDNISNVLVNKFNGDK